MSLGVSIVEMVLKVMEGNEITGGVMEPREKRKGSKKTPSTGQQCFKQAHAHPVPAKCSQAGKPLLHRQMPLRPSHPGERLQSEGVKIRVKASDTTHDITQHLPSRKAHLGSGLASVSSSAIHAYDVCSTLLKPRTQDTAFFFWASIPVPPVPWTQEPLSPVPAPAL